MFRPEAQSGALEDFTQDPGAPRSRSPLAVAIVSDDPETARALARACEAMPSFDCRLRIGALRPDIADMRPQPDEVLIYDQANAPDRQIEPGQFGAAPCVLIGHGGIGSVGPFDAGTSQDATLNFADLSPSAMESAIRSALLRCRLLRDSRDRIEALEASLAQAREARRRAIEDVAPIARALDGLLDIMHGGGEDESKVHLGLLRNWTRDLVAAVERHQRALADAEGPRVDICAIVERAIAACEERGALRNQTLVLSSPAEPVMVPAETRELRATVRQLIESVLEREPADRRIDIVLWRSLEECRLAFVSGPAVRRGDKEETQSAPRVREASGADTRFIGALTRLRDLGGVVESHSASAFGASLLVSLPVVRSQNPRRSISDAID